MRSLAAFGLLVACSSGPPPRAAASSSCSSESFVLIEDYGSWQSATTIGCVDGVPKIEQGGPDWRSVIELDRATWDAFWRVVSSDGALACGRSVALARTTVSITGASTPRSIACERAQIGGAAAEAVEKVRAWRRGRVLRRETDACSTDPSACPVKN